MQSYADDWGTSGYVLEPTGLQQIRAHSVLSGGSGLDDYQDPYGYSGVFTQDHIDGILF